MKAEPKTCSKCGGTGLIYKPAIGLTAVKRCSCTKLKKLKNSGIPEKLQKITFDSFELSNYPKKKAKDSDVTYNDLAVSALYSAKEFVKQFKAGKANRGLLLYGNPGSGKTLLALAIANEIIAAKNDFTVQFIVVPEWLDQIRFSYKEKNPDITEKDLMSNAMDVDLLILDDLGAHRYSEFTSEKIFTVLNNRINTGKATVITTNLLGRELTGSVGERTFSRFFELCLPFPLLIDKDMRLKKNNINQNEPVIVNRVKKITGQPIEKPKLNKNEVYGPGANKDYDITKSTQDKVVNPKPNIKPQEEVVTNSNPAGGITPIARAANSSLFQENSVESINSNWGKNDKGR